MNAYACMYTYIHMCVHMYTCTYTPTYIYPYNIFSGNKLITEIAKTDIKRNGWKFVALKTMGPQGCWGPEQRLNPITIIGWLSRRESPNHHVSHLWNTLITRSSLTVLGMLQSSMRLFLCKFCDLLEGSITDINVITIMAMQKELIN